MKSSINSNRFALNIAAKARSYAMIQHKSDL